MRSVILILSLFVLTIIGCKKEYPDDRWRHTKTPFKRLTAHEWSYFSHEDLTSYQFTFNSRVRERSIKFKTDGTCEGIFPTDGGPTSYSYNFKGNWELIDDDNKIKITHNSSHYSIWTIHQLERTCFVISNDSIKYHLIK